MKHSETESPDRGIAPLLPHRTFSQAMGATLAMQYALGRNALALTRFATHQQLALFGAMTATDQQTAQDAVETGFDAIETVAEESERTAAESVATTSEAAEDVTDASAAAIESTFDTFLDTSAPLGHPPEHRPERRPTA